MPGFSFLELLFVFCLVLILFGPKELPRLARLLARWIYEMKNIFQRLEKQWDLEHSDQNSFHSSDKKSQEDISVKSTRSTQSNE